MNFLFAWRYFKSKKTTNAVNIIAWISIVAIMVGSAALVIVLSVFNGFESLVKGMYGDFYADAKIAPAKGKMFQFTATQKQQLQQNKSIAHFSFVVEEKGLLKNGDNQATVISKGVDENYTHVNKIEPHILRGNYNLGTQEKPLLVIGAGIENATNLYTENAVEPAVLYLPNKKAATLNNLNDALNSFHVFGSGTFVIQQDFDNKYIFTNMAFMKYMLEMKEDEFSYIELKLQATNDKAIETICKQLQQQLGNSFLVQSRYQQNQSLYNIMKMEKWIIYGILSLILVVAAFNMIGALTMLVLEKQKDIAILKAMGANEQKIKNIFLNTGFILAGIGALTGISIASLICWLQINFKLLKLGGSFVIDYYPVEQRGNDILLVLTTVLVVTFLASYFPAQKAAKQFEELKS